MRAVVLNPPTGSSENMVVAEIPEPQAGAGEAVVAVSFGGCNFADTMMRRGIYPHPKGYPLVAGIEMAGIVASVGPGVTAIEVGQRVACAPGPDNAYALHRVVPAERCVPLPDAIDDRTAAAMLGRGMTARFLLFAAYRLLPGETVLDTAAAVTRTVSPWSSR